MPALETDHFTTEIQIQQNQRQEDGEQYHYGNFSKYKMEFKPRQWWGAQGMKGEHNKRVEGVNRHSSVKKTCLQVKILFLTCTQESSLGWAQKAVELKKTEKWELCNVCIPIQCYSYRIQLSRLGVGLSLWITCLASTRTWVWFLEPTLKQVQGWVWVLAIPGPRRRRQADPRGLLDSQLDPTLSFQTRKKPCTPPPKKSHITCEWQLKLSSGHVYTYTHRTTHKQHTKSIAN